MNMGPRIRDYIKSKGLKFSYVAELAGFDVKKFSRMMNGHQKITTDEYEQICVKALGLEPGYFFSPKVLDTKNKKTA